MTDEQKANAFCCTSQAIRSIKSRLKKKMEKSQEELTSWSRYRTCSRG